MERNDVLEVLGGENIAQQRLVDRCDLEQVHARTAPVVRRR